MADPFQRQVGGGGAETETIVTRRDGPDALAVGPFGPPGKLVRRHVKADPGRGAGIQIDAQEAFELQWFKRLA